MLISANFWLFLLKLLNNKFFITFCIWLKLMWMYVMYDSIILGIKLIKSELRLNGIVKDHTWWWIDFVVWLTDKRSLALFQPGPLSEIFTIANLSHVASKQDSNLRKTWVCWVKWAVVIITTPRNHLYWELIPARKKKV